ncbi:hypothetical protein L0F63_001802, partial [Massospora cicadina]
YLLIASFVASLAMSGLAHKQTDEERHQKMMRRIEKQWDTLSNNQSRAYDERIKLVKELTKRFDTKMAHEVAREHNPNPSPVSHRPTSIHPRQQGTLPTFSIKDGQCPNGEKEEYLKAYSDKTVVNQTWVPCRWKCELAPQVRDFHTYFNQCEERERRGESIEWATGRYYQLTGCNITEDITWDKLNHSTSAQISATPTLHSIMVFRPGSPDIDLMGHFAFVESIGKGELCVSEWEAPYRFELTTTLMKYRDDDDDVKYLKC